MIVTPAARAMAPSGGLSMTMRTPFKRTSASDVRPTETA